MRILLSTFGSRGDVEPLVGLAVALMAQGAEAIVSAPADREFVDLLAWAGVPLAPAFMPIRDFIAMAQQSPMPLPERAEEVATAQSKAISKAAQGCDAIVATGLFPSVTAARCVAEQKAIRYFHTALCPMYLPSEDHAPFAYPGRPRPDGADNRTLWALDHDTQNALFGPATNGLRASLGLPLVDKVRDPAITDRPLLASDPVLWPWKPTDLCDAVQTGAWILPDDRPLPLALESFLKAGAAPVYVGFGSMPTQDPKVAARAAIKAIRAHGRRVVMHHGWADLVLIDDLDDCFIVGEVNQQALFRRVAAVMHHGGAGTTTTAARAGAPQVIVPQIVDQPYWATRVAGLGIGAAHEGPSPTLESLSAALSLALAPQTAERAKAVAGRIRTDGAMVAARTLLEAIQSKAPLAHL